jgi:hypothetical protein
MRLHTISLAAAALAISALAPATAFEPTPERTEVNYSRTADERTEPAVQATPIPAERSAGYCVTPVISCFIWGPPTWGVPCYCYSTPYTYYGYTNG